MAALAAEPLPASWLAVLARLQPAPGRWAFTLRVALICALTACAVSIFGTPDAALTIYLVFFLNRPDRTESIVTSVAMLLLISFIIAFSMIAAIVVVNSPLERVVAIAVISFGLLFLTSASKLRPVGSNIALVVGYALDLLGTVAVGEEATRGLLYVWLFMAFPVAASILVNLLIAPSPRSLLQKGLAGRLVLAADLLSTPGPASAVQLERTLRSGDATLNGYLRMIGLERSEPRATLAALGQAIRSSTVVLQLLDLAAREGHSLDPAIAGRLTPSLRSMAAIFADGSYPVSVERVLGFLEPAATNDAQLAVELDKALVGFAVADGKDCPLPAVHTGFFEPDAFTSETHVLFAMRTTAAALFCYILYSLLDWPGIHTCFLTCYIVSLGTAAESVEKLVLRIAGCLVGAAFGYAALLLILPWVTSVGGLMVVVFIGTAAAAWVVAGGPFVAYGGLQFAFAFLLCVVQGPAPAFDLTVARDRVIGILIGNLVTYLALTRLWPSSVATRIDLTIARLVDLLAQAARTPAMAAAAVGAVGTDMGNIARDIELASYEPDGMGRGSAWRSSQWRLAKAVDRIAAPLLLATRTSMHGLDAVGAELDALARQIRGQAASATERSDPRLPSLKVAVTDLRKEVGASLHNRGNAHAAA